MSLKWPLPVLYLLNQTQAYLVNVTSIKQTFKNGTKLGSKFKNDEFLWEMNI